LKWLTFGSQNLIKRGWISASFVEKPAFDKGLIGKIILLTKRRAVTLNVMLKPGKQRKKFEVTFGSRETQE